MSIRIALENPPEFYTNLDTVAGRVVLHLSRPEHIGAIVVKLEGESKTALGLPQGYDDRAQRPGGGPGSIASENHKILYRVAQVFPTYEEDLGAGGSSFAQSYMVQGGQHEFPFRFKLPINNACSDPVAMSKMGGIGGMGGFGAGIGPFGLGGARVMDGSKQLFLQHVTKTLPPSFTGFPRQAEVRYYIKVTIQRPGFLKENWRYQVGFKFMPIEPPRPPKTSQEAYARRPFTFKPRPQGLQKKKSSLFGSSREDVSGEADVLPPSIELSARLPHPSILTCNQPLPLRLIAKKLVPSHEQVYLTSIQIELIGKTHVRCHDLVNTEVSRWIVLSQTGLSTPILTNPASDDLSAESVIPDDVWRNAALPNTVAPTFVACNLQRDYELDIKLGLCWGKPSASSRGLLGSKENPTAQTIYLPLHFSKVQIYSGIAPPPQLLEALAQQASRPAAATLSVPPRLPPRTAQSAPATATQQRPHQAHAPQHPPAPQYDPLYPPQIGTPGASGFDEAPPSYDEAMAAGASAPESRPAYSGVTNENAPSQIPEKS
ncbi:Arrestin-related trafficking adapter 10 [Colletotrichum chlorophyti]|uniref:Arrestin-related trafficking adapter 10 n=1 Tax=Colletotrichum chlorophyti TaxID=708187 RepID=A0A1Q8RD57_9PEZI|nr:Arrestin-related trafficking adapter 10 [Colletotrichum chlorophyti]